MDNVAVILYSVLGQPIDFTFIDHATILSLPRQEIFIPTPFTTDCTDGKVDVRCAFNWLPYSRHV